MPPRLFKAGELLTLADIRRSCPACYINDAVKVDIDTGFGRLLELDEDEIPTEPGRVASVLQRLRDGAGHLTLGWGSAFCDGSIRVQLILPASNGEEPLTR